MKTLFVSLLVTLWSTVLAASDAQPEATHYDSAQRLLCTRADGDVSLDQKVAFDLVVEPKQGGMRYDYRPYRPGAPRTGFSVRNDRVTCEVTPVTGEEAEPIRKYEGPHQLVCTNNGMQVGWPVATSSLTEQRDGDMLRYDYVMIRGGGLQSIVISAETGACTISGLD